MKKEKGIKFDLVFFKKNIALILFLALLVFNIVATNNFLSWITFNNFFKQVSRVVLVSLGMSLVIATGGIDISVGSAMALGSVLAGIGNCTSVSDSNYLFHPAGCGFWMSGRCSSLQVRDSSHGSDFGTPLYYAWYG